MKNFWKIFITLFTIAVFAITHYWLERLTGRMWQPRYSRYHFIKVKDESKMTLSKASYVLNQTLIGSILLDQKTGETWMLQEGKETGIGWGQLNYSRLSFSTKTKEIRFHTSYFPKSTLDFPETGDDQSTPFIPAFKALMVRDEEKADPLFANQNCQDEQLGIDPNTKENLVCKDGKWVKA